MLFFQFAIYTAAALGQTNFSVGRMTGDSWSTGAEVAEHTERQNLLEGRIIVEGLKEVFCWNREAGAGKGSTCCSEICR